MNKSTIQGTLCRSNKGSRYHVACLDGHHAGAETRSSENASNSILQAAVEQEQSSHSLSRPLEDHHDRPVRLLLLDFADGSSWHGLLEDQQIARDEILAGG